MVERNLAKVEVASSNLVSRSKFDQGSNTMLPFFVKVNGAIAKRLCTGLQIRLAQFDSGSRLHQTKATVSGQLLFFRPHSFAQFLPLARVALHMRQGVAAWLQLARPWC